MVPHPVMLGFVNGLAIVIALAQLGHFKVKDAAGAEHWIAGSSLYVMIGLIVATMFIIYLLPKLTKAVPSSLIAIIAVALLSIFSGIHTKTVGDMASIRGGFPKFHLAAVPYNLATLRIIVPYAFILAGAGLIETLLTLNLVDEMTDRRGRPNRECLAQGAGNIICGFFGAMAAAP